MVFPEGNSAKESMKVCAASAGAAYAWVAAARGAIRIAKRQTVSSVSLVFVVGPEGLAHPDHALAIAMNELVIRRGKLLCGSKLKIRGQRKAA